MIVLNTAKELVRVETWEDILERPGFTDNLDPSQHTLSAIIGQYAFTDWIRCGLSNCHTPHARGYLVVTKSGLETNIGKDCGKSYFGVDFETLAAQFDRDMREKQARERLWDFSFRLDDVKQKVRDLRGGERGADWVYRTTSALTEPGKGVPGAIVRQVATMLKTGQSALTKDRPATEREIEIAESGGQRVKRPYFITEQIGEIRGMEALHKENDLRALLIVDLEEHIKAFEKLSIDAMAPGDLGKWSKWAGTVDATLEKAAAAVASGRVLLTASNLSPFTNVISDDVDVKQFRAYLKLLG